VQSPCLKINAKAISAQLKERHEMGTRQFLLDARREPGKKIFEHSRNFVFGRPKLMRFNPQRSGEAEQLKIGNPTELRFNFGKRLSA
jgi:hypothetical protein